MESPEREDGLTELNKRLYAREAEPLRARRSELTPGENTLKRDWGLRAATAVTRPRRPSIWSVDFLWKFFLIAVGFFVLALLAAGFFLFRGNNVVSNANIDIAVTGPLSIKSGDQFDLGIAISNKNRSDLETADLIIEYPAGTRDPNDPSKELTRSRESLGVITSGQTLVHGVRAILFGSEKTKGQIKIKLEYRLAGSNAIFEKEKPFAVEIADSPVSLALTLPEEVNAGKEIEATVQVVTNSPTILKDVTLLALWPPGFNLLESSLQGENNLNTTRWSLGDMAPGAKRTFVIKGTLDGQAEEVKSFRFQVGLAGKEDTELGAVYTDNFKTVAIKRPFVGLALNINGDQSSEPVARLGNNIEAQIAWGNNLDVDVLNGSLKLTLNGESLNRSTVSVSDGFYRSSDNTITWSQSAVPGLALLRPGDRGQAQLSFQSLPFSSAAPIKNPTINLGLIFKAEQKNGSDNIETRIDRVIKLEAAFAAASQLLYHEGPFENTGPIPPRADQQTTYTVVWTLGTAANEVKDARIKAVLPANVEWTKELSPSTEKLSWNEVTRQLTWEAGYLSTGTKGEGKTKTVAFQVKAEPSVSQAGEEFNILDKVEASGTDTFTGTTVSRSLGVLDSRFSTDPGFRANDERVAP